MRKEDLIRDSTDRVRGVSLHTHHTCAFRWARLAQQPLKQQLMSPECLCLGFLFSLNVLALQLYLGTARVQLEGKGDSDRTYTRTLSFIVPGIVVLTPVNGALLDRLGYGIVLVIINTLNLCSIFCQMVPSLQAQVRSGPISDTRAVSLVMRALF